MMKHLLTRALAPARQPHAGIGATLLAKLQEFHRDRKDALEAASPWASTVAAPVGRD